MDKERAKFVLQSFRPDGADVGDADFAEALRFATSDRELGEWLMSERAFDAEFAEALARVDLPEGLRERVLLGMVQDGGDAPRIDMKKESEMISAMASINVPSDLRGRVLEAMEQTSKVEVIERNWSWTRFGIPLAAAASIALAFVILRQSPSDGEATVEVDKITTEAVEAGFVRTYESPIFSLDTHHHDAGVLMASLRKKGLPVADADLPQGLESLKGMGCRELLIDGKVGTLVCFDVGSGVLHLVTFDRNDISDALPGVNTPEFSKDGEWVSATWGDEANAYTLMGRSTDVGELNRFF